jgi:hypothetical protein
MHIAIAADQKIWTEVHSQNDKHVDDLYSSRQVRGDSVCAT